MATKKPKMTAAKLTQASAEQLMDDLHTVLEDAEALLSATAGQAGERIQQVRARAEETVRAARDRLAETQEDLTRRYGRGPWSLAATEKGVLFGLRHSRTTSSSVSVKILSCFALS